MTRGRAARIGAALAARQRSLSAALLAAVLVGLLVIGGGAQQASSADDGRLRVVTTTPILADLARNVAGEHARVTSLVPESGDPHTYEPSLRNVRDIVYADVAFSNYLMLEQQAVIKALDANLRPGIPNVSLAEGAQKHGAQIIPLVENVQLDTVWLGVRVRGTGGAHGADRSSQVRLKGTGMRGPGQLTAYLTETFGNPQPYLDSADGFDAGSGYARDTFTLPADAHTHMSWAFSQPGVYTLDMEGELAPRPGVRPHPMGRATLTFAVGVNPHEVPGMAGARVLSAGHADVTVDLDQRRVYLYADGAAAGGKGHVELDPARTVIEVPGKALTDIPGSPDYRFLGKPGAPVYLLPQAVLGKHVHGEIDPHLWQDVRNAKAYVKLIADTLATADPAHATGYRANAARYLATLDETDRYVGARIRAVPAADRYLATTHDAFGYLAAAYGIPVAGFVSPNPGTEPSIAQRKRLVTTLRDLRVRAVFLEPNLAQRAPELRSVADELDLRVCRIYGDAFDREVRSYVAMMRANADSIHDCLTQPPKES